MIDMAIYLVKNGITPVMDMKIMDKCQKRDEFVICEEKLRNCLIKKYPREYQDWKFEKSHD